MKLLVLFFVSFEITNFVINCTIFISNGNFRSESGGSMKNKEISNSCSVAIGTNKDFMDDDSQWVLSIFFLLRILSNRILWHVLFLEYHSEAFYYPKKCGENVEEKSILRLKFCFLAAWKSHIRPAKRAGISDFLSVVNWFCRMGCLAKRTQLHAKWLPLLCDGSFTPPFHLTNILPAKFTRCSQACIRWRKQSSYKFLITKLTRSIMKSTSKGNGVTKMNGWM